MDIKEEYAKVSKRKWSDQRFRNLSLPAQWMFDRIMTGPEMTSIGAAKFNPLWVASRFENDIETTMNAFEEIALDVSDDLEILFPNGLVSDTPKGFAEAFAKAFTEGFGEPFLEAYLEPMRNPLSKPLFLYDSAAELIVKIKHYEHNIPDHIHATKHRIGAVMRLPECTLRNIHFLDFAAFIHNSGKGFPEALPKALTKGLPKGFAEAIAKPKTKTKTKDVVQRTTLSASTKSGKSRTKKPKPALKENEIAILQKIEDAWNAGAGDTIQTVKDLATQDYARDVLRAFEPTASIGMTLPDPGSVTRFVRWASNRDYLNGSDGKWSITLKWLVRPDKIDKVLDQLGQFQAEGDDRVVGAVSIEELDREHIEALTRKFSERVQMHWGDDTKLAKDKSDLADACNRVGLKIDWGEIVKIAESNLAGV